MGFWIAVAAVSALTALALARPFLAARAPGRSRAAHEEQVFRDQLAEIDRDVERGVLDPAEAESARVEVSRRLLAAASERERAAGPTPAPRRASAATAAALAVAAPVGAFLIYGAIGAPDLPDQPIALRAEGVRPSQEAAEARVERPDPPGPPAEDAARLAELESARAAGSLDRRGLYDLAQGYSAHGRYAEAWRAYAELVGAGGDAPAAIHAALGESMVLAAGGYVSPEAEAAFDAAMERDPSNPVARYYLGAAYAQTRRPRSALDVWSRLLADSPADAPWVEPVRAQIGDLVERTGLPAPEIAARRPTEDERREAILGMVRRLDDRLAAEGGAPEEWARLAVSWRVLGRDAEADEAAARARAALADDAEGLASFEEALAAADEAAREAAALAERAAALEEAAAAGGSAEDWAALVAARRALGGPAAAQEAASRARAALADDAEALAAFETAAAAPGDARTAAPSPPGPGRAEVAAAAELGAGERGEMIRGMVEGLRDRLYAGGGSAEEWARLVRSLAVLGRRDDAQDAYARGLEAVGEDAAGRARLAEEARAAGLEAR